MLLSGPATNIIDGMRELDVVEQFEYLLPEDGTLESPMEGVTLFRVSHPVERLAGIYPPAACIILQGAKRAYFQGGVHDYDASQYLCSAVPLPVEGEVRGASVEKPLLGMMVSFETRAMTEACLAYEAAVGPAHLTSDGDFFITPSWDPAFRRAVAGVLEALGDSALFEVVGQGRLKELLVAILRGTAGSMIRARVSRYRTLMDVIQHIRAHLAGDLNVEELARRAGMSRPVFHRHFKRATSLTPIQFVKTLRLNEGARLIAHGAPVGISAAQVGYASASQFSREFRRQFGYSPREWPHAAASVPRDPQLGHQ